MFPVALGGLATYLNNGGFQAEVYNADHVFESRPLLSNSDYISRHEDYLLKQNDLESTCWRDIRQTIASYDPDVVGVSVMSATLDSSLKIAAISKDVNSGCVTVFGGVHPSLVPLTAMNWPNVEFVVRGDGEDPLLRLCRALQDGLSTSDIPNVIDIRNENSRGDVSLSRHSDVSSPEYPNRHTLIGVECYSPMSLGAIVSARGCPFKCVFCASSAYSGRKVRYRPVENIISEIQHCATLFRTSTFRFLDDTFTLNPTRMEEFCERLLENRLKIQWYCNTRMDQLNAKLIRKMVEAGCKEMDLGVEVGNERHRQMLGKNLENKKIRETVSLIKKYDVLTEGFMIYGLPFERVEDVRETLAFADELSLDSYEFNIVKPYPGTALFEEMVSTRKIPSVEEIDWRRMHQGSPDYFLMDVDESTKWMIIEEVASFSRRYHRRKRAKHLARGAFKAIRNPKNAMKKITSKLRRR